MPLCVKKIQSEAWLILAGNTRQVSCWSGSILWIPRSYVTKMTVNALFHFLAKTLNFWNVNTKYIIVILVSDHLGNLCQFPELLCQGPIWRGCRHIRPNRCRCRRRWWCRLLVKRSKTHHTHCTRLGWTNLLECFKMGRSEI